MAEIIRMPKMSDTMEQGILVSWLKKEGDKVQSGDLLAEVETDKATMELEAYEEGTLLHIGVQAGAAVPVNGMLAIIGEAGEDIKPLLAQIDQPTQATPEQKATAMPTKASDPQPASPSTDAAPPSPQRLIASPLAKKMAQEAGFDLATIKGTGPSGRIIQRDIAAKMAQAAVPTDSTITPLQEAYQDIPVSSMQRTIAQRLTSSKAAAPHFYLTLSIDMEEAVKSRAQLNAQTTCKISFNDMVLKAVSIALRQCPSINVSWQEDVLRHYQHIHIGVALSTAEGLWVPVIRFADTKSLTQIATEVRDFRKKALQKKLTPQMLTGSTFTLSNLGMLGIEAFTSIINAPAACILAVGAIQQVPVVRENTIVPRHQMKVTLSCDHRVVDGATGAHWLQTLKRLLEHPMCMLA